MFALSHMMLKTLSYNYPDSDANNTSLIRFTTVLALNYYYINYVDKKTYSFSELKYNISFWVRLSSSYIILLSLANSVFYLRYSTAIAFMFVSPVVIGTYSIIFLKEKLRLRTVVGLILCLTAIGVYIYGDQESDKFENDTGKFMLGIFWGIISLLGTSAMMISIKSLVQKVDSFVINYFIGMFSTAVSIIVLVVFNLSFTFRLGEVLLSFLSGFFFTCALVFVNSSVKFNNLLAMSCISYLTIVYGFLFGFVFFGESIKLTDFVASFIIIGYNLYDVLYPSKDK
jgi:drug/metabolite transporter (DMT)-like permease